MSIEQLMQPRYKVIADYPCRPHPIGSIIEFTNDPYDTRTLFTLPGAEHRYPESKFKEYPNLFKPLQWWEERKPEDMPQYIRFKPDNTLFKIEQWDMPILFGFTDVERQRGCGLKTFKPEYGYEPATEAEYLTYINSKNGKKQHC